MQLRSNTHQRSEEYRRYFPDWTAQPLEVGEELDADHSSYLAGGYAEEFGYLAGAEFYRGAPSIGGNSPDDDAFRLFQWAGIHPGYPLRPHPISVERERAARRRGSSPSSGGVARRLGEPEGKGHGEFMRVTERPYEHAHRQLAHRMAAATVRFLGAVVALRWQLSLRPGERQPGE